MSWATPYISALLEGKTVQFRPKGNSMQPRIESGQLVTVEPLKASPVVGDVVLCKVQGKQWLHLVKAIDSNNRFQIGNNKGHINGYCGLESIYGIVSNIEN